MKSKTKTETRTFEFPSINTPQGGNALIWDSRKVKAPAPVAPLGFFGNIGDDDDKGNRGRRNIRWSKFRQHPGKRPGPPLSWMFSKSLTSVAAGKLSKDELGSAVESLPEESLYQVIFFSGPAWFCSSANRRRRAGPRRTCPRDQRRRRNPSNGKVDLAVFEYDGGTEKSRLQASGSKRPPGPISKRPLADIEAVGKIIRNNLASTPHDGPSTWILRRRIFIL